MTTLLNEPWRIQLLGSLRAWQGEDEQQRTITRFRTQKTGALLAYLAYHLGRSHPREVLIELLWPDLSPEAGRHILSNSLSSLRNQFEPPGVPAGSVIVADRLSVELNPAAVATDVATFEQALRAAAQVKGGVQRAERLAEALALYAGPLLPGYYEEWILPEQERLQERFLEAVHQLCTLAERGEGDVPLAMEYARRAVAAAPLREEIHQDLIRLLLAAGSPETALRQYREMERVLADELGAPPSATSRQLLRLIEEQGAPATGPATNVAVATPPASPAVVSPVLPAPVPATAAMTLPTLPTGTVTFLLTDIEGSTVRWEKAGDTFRAALERHHALLRDTFRRYGGHEVKEQGDAFLVAFPAASDALSCVVACQKALAREPWPEPVGSVPVRMALHSGDVQRDEAGDDYHGLVLHRASRMLSAAHGGQILLSEATAALVRQDLEAGVRLVDLGLYRLRGVESPERLFQVEYPEMARREFPPISAQRAHTGSLPLQFTRFFGREQEIQQIEHVLRAGETRLLTLTGPGGTGKTRLAIEAAGRLLEPLNGAIWFVPLADVSDPGLIAGAIVGALHLPRTGETEPKEQIVEALSRQPSLLLLDNFEQLVEGGAEIVHALLDRVPTLTCVVTSRQLLGLPGEREFVVAPLPTPQGQDSPVLLSAYESVRLFVDRAQAVKPDFQVTNNNAPAVAELCDRLEGMPLAIELAAARAQVLTPTQMLAQLGKRFEFLVSRKRGVVERQRTLRAAIDWSYRLLPSELQQFFAGLSVFRGGWTAEAAEAVTGEPLALDYLAQLRECSLVLTDDTRQEMRFRMLDTLREYAGEKLTEAGAVQPVRRRHAEFFLRLVEEGQNAEQPGWLDRLDIEHDNLRAALDYCQQDDSEATAASAETALRLAGLLWRFWLRRGHWSEARRRLAAVLERTQTAEPTRARAEALAGAGELAYAQSDHAGADDYWKQRLDGLRRLGDTVGVADALSTLARSAMFRGDVETPGALIEEALALFREAGEERGVIHSLNNLATLARNRGDYAAARALYEEALARVRKTGPERGVAWSLTYLGNLAELEGDPALARRYYEEALAIRRGLEEKRDLAISLDNVGCLAQNEHDYVTARTLFEERLAVVRELGDKEAVAHALRRLGDLAKDEAKSAAAARALYEEALQIHQELGDKRGAAWTLSGLGLLCKDQGDLQAARSFYNESLALSREVEDRYHIAGALINLSDLAIQEGNFGPVHGWLTEALTLAKDFDNKRITVSALKQFARLAAAQPRHRERAARLFGAAEGLRETISRPFTADEWDDNTIYAAEVGRVRTALGEEAFAAAWEQGRAMTLDDAIAFARDEEQENQQ